ncbi:hypothetical protein J1N35_008097 [Gossypium stocksii]|uniref:Uncharacterized protein n=1 Tax=Gossypium stocksii TaxID=47602 RepID=A0A9D4AFU5_9ROSI|nr:hypothetical protein J1N35_008097 [Gossypium stocksii]
MAHQDERFSRESSSNKKVRGETSNGPDKLNSFADWFANQPENVGNLDQHDTHHIFNHNFPLDEEEGYRVQANSWQQEVDALYRGVLALHLNIEDIDWIFCSNNPLVSKIAIMGLPLEFKVLNKVFEGRRDPWSHLMQYNDYMNVLEPSYATKCKAFSTTLRASAKD